MNDANLNSRNRLLQFRLRTLLAIPVLIALYFAIGAFTSQFVPESLGSVFAFVGIVIASTAPAQ